MRNPSISDAEWEVMNVIWDRNPVTASEVVEAIATESGRSPRTVKTMLNRLLKKGILSHEVEGKRYLYRPVVSREACVERASESFLSRVFHGDEAPMIAKLVRNADLTAEDIERLRKELEDKSRAEGEVSE